jgi:SAM-dependent methyltransferase
MSHARTDPRSDLVGALASAVRGGTLTKLTLGKYSGPDPSLRNLYVRPVVVGGGPRLSFVWRHATRDVTKNHPPEEALLLLDPLIGGDFLDAHLYTASETLQLECEPGGTARLRRIASGSTAGPAEGHDRAKSHPIPADSGWLRKLGVTNDRGQPREGMAPKFRQIQKFAELLSHLLEEAGLRNRSEPLRIADMGSGKGYLTFALASVLGGGARIRGIEARPELVELCNRIAREEALDERLSFAAGAIADAPLDRIDVLIALHACDTATDDALARGIAAGAALLVVAPCCQKELRPQLEAPPVLAPALRHGIWRERQAEFATDALRALLLEWAGYRTKAFEFVSTEHTAKNLMLSAIRAHPPGDPSRAAAIRDFAAFYGVRRQALAGQLGFALRPD